jgi:hypothetical protein
MPDDLETSMRFNREKRDGNHKTLVDYLRGHGIEAIETFRPLDVLVFNGSKAGWIEVKTTSRSAAIMRTQIEFMANTKMPVAFVKTEDEALKFASSMDGLTQGQKDSLAIFLQTATKKQYHPAVIERVLDWI